jgi:DNA-binding NtrC family response regulator
VLENQEVTRIGSNDAIKVNVRLVSATHRDLEAAVRDGRFRQDLYFRLKVATLVVPSLADRRDDIPLLAQHFVARFTVRHERPGLRLTPDAVAALSERPWPGNVRELENVIEQAVVMTAGTTIGPADLGLDAPAAVPGLRYHAAVQTAVDGTERTLIERALAETNNNRTQAARLLGIGRRTLLYKLKRYGLTTA